MPRRFGEQDRENPYARRMALLEIIYLNKEKVRISDLATQFAIPHNLLAYDLEQLEQLGLVERGYGWVKRRTVGLETLFDGSEFVARLGRAREAKEKIARYIAEKLIAPGDQVVFDAGTTAFLVARHLVEMEKRVAVWTNNIPLFLYVLVNSNMSCHLVGGELSRTNAALVGEEPARQIAKEKFNLAVVTPKGVLVQEFEKLRQSICSPTERAEEGADAFRKALKEYLEKNSDVNGIAVTMFNEDLAQHSYKRAMVLSATKVVIAVDKSKWAAVGRPFFAFMCPMEVGKRIGAVRTRGAAFPPGERLVQEEWVKEWLASELAIVTDATSEMISAACPDIDRLFSKWAALKAEDKGLICLGD